MKSFLKYWLAPLAANLALAAHLVSQDPGWYGLKVALIRVECLAGSPPMLAQGLHQGFAREQAPAQMLLEAVPSAVRLEPTDTPGWSQYTVPDGAGTQSLVFEVAAAGEFLVFHPRASGPDSRVEAVLLEGGRTRATALLQGRQGEWTPIGARWLLPLACADTSRPLRVRVTLSGPWAQLWVRGGEAFFLP